MSDFKNKSRCVQWFLLFNAILVHWRLFITVLEYGSWINLVTETACIVFKEIMVYRMRDSNPWLMTFFLWTVLLSCCCCEHFCWIHWNFSPVYIVTINTYLSDHVHLCCQITCLHVNTSCCHLTRPIHTVAKSHRATYLAQALCIPIRAPVEGTCQGVLRGSWLWCFEGHLLRTLRGTC